MLPAPLKFITSGNINILFEFNIESEGHRFVIIKITISARFLVTEFTAFVGHSNKGSEDWH